MRTSLTFIILLFSFSLNAKEVVIGSKVFTEGYVISEIIAQKLEEKGIKVNRRFGLGATGIVYEAIKNQKIDLYVEYTGTLNNAILKDASLLSKKDLDREFLKKGQVLSRSLGFSNTYAFVVTQDFAQKHALRRVSDLKRVQKFIRLGFSYEFMNRKDGYPAFLKAYQLTFDVAPQSMEHSLLYQSIESSRFDGAEVYSTDGKINALNLKLLEDDLHFFPEYEAVIIADKEFVQENPEIWSLLKSFEGTISASKMRQLNALADIDRHSFYKIARHFLYGEGLEQSGDFFGDPRWSLLWQRSKEHLFLVFVAVFLSTLFGIPLGILSTRKKWLEQTVLLMSGMIQTIPSLALLCFLIPVLGIGTQPAIFALFLYGLLPVVLNTYTGLQSIEVKYIESAKALGLSPWNRLTRVELPLASQSIWAGVTTSTIISIGTATLAALIGAGGYGAAIVTGLALNDTKTILFGAVPAALLALVTQFLLKKLGSFVIPRGLQ